MRFHISKRCLVRIVSFALVGVAAVGGTFLKMNDRFVHLERQLVHRYQASLEDLSASMDSMAVTLMKSLYTGTPAALSSLTNELVLQAGTAGAALSALPIEQQSVSTVSKFLSQVSDYSLALTKRVVGGGTITEEERDTLSSLAEVAADLSVRLEEARMMYNDSGSWEESIASALSGAESVSGLDTSLTEAEESLGDYPTLIYDGPFSDHITTRQSQLLANGTEITLDEAKAKAASALGMEPPQLTHTGEEDGTMPSFVFSFDGGSIAVTKISGYTTYFRKERDISESQMSYEQAVEKAEAYLDSLQLGDFEETYYFTDEGICVVNFALEENDIICYTDLIKVGIALDTGEVMFYEARGYLMNHHPRSLPEPTHSAEEAKASISRHLTVNEVDLAVIPSGGEHELYCYEFHCTGDGGEDILVYINTETLAEEQILVLLKTDGGTLTK